jgi:hypothetical protein
VVLAANSHIDVSVLIFIAKVIPTFFEELYAKQTKAQYFLKMRAATPLNHGIVMY